MSDFVCVACNTGKALLPESIGAQLCKMCYLDNGQQPSAATVTSPKEETDVKSESEVDETQPSSSGGVQTQKRKKKSATIAAVEEKIEVARWTRLRNKTAMGPPPPPPPLPPKKRTIKRKVVPCGVGRRTLFKSTPKKSPSNTATTITSDQVYFEVQQKHNNL